MDEWLRMERLTTVGGSFAARVLEARLRSEGIDVELRGSIDSPYQFTLGSMSEIEVYVPGWDLDDARMLMLADEIESIFDDDPPRPRTSHHTSLLFWIALVTVVIAGVVPILRLAVLGDPRPRPAGTPAVVR
ncbi:MAG: putative prokaryotic signal transducing protein [Candidatus Eremiobacteraeota bacterium]|jgi:hypothetical protein|nr:putative prokaryotic signal transducing protein [Candidatus Eremiobacteraeota bacterium]